MRASLLVVARVSPVTRWDLVEIAERDELRKLTPAAKLGQLASLMASVEQMGWSEALQEGDEDIWMRWQAMRRRAAAGRTPRRK
jgi:hypothetical protein